MLRGRYLHHDTFSLQHIPWQCTQVASHDICTGKWAHLVASKLTRSHQGHTNQPRLWLTGAADRPGSGSCCQPMCNFQEQSLQQGQRGRAAGTTFKRGGGEVVGGGGGGGDDREVVRPMSCTSSTLPDGRCISRSAAHPAACRLTCEVRSYR